MRIAVIINPISGPAGGRLSAADRGALARTHLVRPDTEVDVAVTHARGHGAALAGGYAGRGFDVVVAWGGDGTINEVAGPLIGTSTALGIVPAGSGDGLARGLGLPVRVKPALAALVAGPADPIDIGRFAGRHFLNIAGVGFDAAVGRQFNERGRRGVTGYLEVAGRIVWGYRSLDYDVRLGEIDLRGPKFLVAFANSREYGNRLVLAPDADPADGWLDAVVVDAGSAIRQVWRARRLTFRSGRPAAGIHRSRVRLASVSGADMWCHVDGEAFVMTGTADVGIEPAALRVAGWTTRRPRWAEG
jgi:diacylglycerol kinase family enzyme